MPNASPIGVFDSGVGGLTVVAAIAKALGNEDLLYLGDTARVPYGTKSAQVVKRYALNAARFLLQRGAKLLVVACNTASAYGLSAIQEHFAQPVVGVVWPGAALAARVTQNQRIGVIGTEGTIASGSYQQALGQLAPRAQVFAAACPLFVPFAEEGLTDHPAARMIAQEYLAPLVTRGIDTLVLGCTHYPLLAPLVQEVVGKQVRLVDSATAVAGEVAQLLGKRDLQTASQQPGRRCFYATDVSQRVVRVGRTFLGNGLEEVELVDL